LHKSLLSAKTGQNIKELFHVVVDVVVSKFPPPQKKLKNVF